MRVKTGFYREINAKPVLLRLSLDGMEIWKNPLSPSEGPNGGIAAMDPVETVRGCVILKKYKS
jgi:hypothetical protein